jgi:hypothetical protein
MNIGKAIFLGCAGIISVCFIVMIGAAVALTFGMQTGHVPDSAARSKKRIPKKQIEQLREADIIDDGEEVQFFYSAGLLSILEDGNLFTDRWVISYETIDGETSLDAAYYHEIEDIEYEEGSLIEDAVITVTLKDGDLFILLVSAESRRDKAFHRELVAMWEAKKDDIPLEAAKRAKAVAKELVDDPDAYPSTDDELELIKPGEDGYEPPSQ